MVTIAKRQKMILIFAGLFLLALAVFLIFIYFPANNRLSKLKQQYSAIELEISEFRKNISADKPLEQVIISLREKLKSMDKKFPRKEETIFKELSALAENMEINIASMKPERKQIVIQEADKPIIKDCVVQEMPISMSINTSYKKLGAFLKALKEEFPIFVNIEDVTLSKSGGEGSSVLAVSLKLNTYLISPKKDELPAGVI